MYIFVIAFKWMALAFKFSVLTKTHIWKPFNVKIPLNDAFLFWNKENKIPFGLPQKGSGIRMVNIMATIPSSKIIIYSSSLFHTQFSAFMIFFIQKKAHLVSTQGPLTLIFIVYLWQRTWHGWWVLLLHQGLFRLDVPTSNQRRHYCMKIITRHVRFECSD